MLLELIVLEYSFFFLHFGTAKKDALDVLESGSGGGGDVIGVVVVVAAAINNFFFRLRPGQQWTKPRTLPLNFLTTSLGLR